MKSTIQAFIDDKKVAIVGASNKNDNFGKTIMKELIKLGYEVYPVNPGCKEIEGTVCLPEVKDLPKEVVNVIMAVPARLTEKIIDKAIGTHMKRVWMIKGVGAGAYTKESHEKCKESDIEVVYGFCPMMFYGKGGHKFHLWIRKTFGKVPAEYLLSGN